MGNSRKYILLAEDVPEIKAKAGEMLIFNASTCLYSRKAVIIGTKAEVLAVKAKLEAKEKAKANKLAEKEKQSKNGGK